MTSEHGFPNDTWVRILCDFAAEGVWNRDGSAGLVDDLPVSPSLKKRITAWQDTYEAIYRWDRKPSIQELTSFAGEGLEIARDVKRQLPHWTVVYFDELAFHNRTEKDPRSVFEYEIR